MSDIKGSTVQAEEVLRRFESNPVGHTVDLDDGRRAVVAEYTDTPKGRWYRLRRRGGPWWVPDHAVVGVVVWTVGLRTYEAAATAGEAA